MLCRGPSETHHAAVRRYGVMGVTYAHLHKRPQTAYLRQKQKLRARIINVHPLPPPITQATARLPYVASVDTSLEVDRGGVASLESAVESVFAMQSPC